ncbi:TPA: hypothetical protein ACGO11_001497 [Streptococcus suis]
MKKVIYSSFLLLATITLVACSSTEKVSENENTPTETTSEVETSNQEKTLKEKFDILYYEYEDLEWIYTTEWEKEQSIKVQGTLLETETEDEFVYCKMSMETGEIFYALIEKELFNEKPLKIGEEVALAGLAFGNNKYNDGVSEDAVYVLEYLPYSWFD